jgi:hypothetical protein
MTGHEEDLIAFLAGDLDPDQAQDFDNHLLSCESCWAAVRADRTARALLERFRGPAPPGLADRVSLAIEVQARSHRRRVRRRPTWLIGVAALVAAALIGLLVTVVPAGSSASPAVTAVVHFARLIPSSSSTFREYPQATPLGAPIALTVGGQRVDLTYYQVGRVEALVASSPRQFAMPSGGRPLGGPSGMAWSATRSGITLFCLNGPRPILLAAAVPLTQLRALAGQLHLS